MWRHRRLRLLPGGRNHRPPAQLDGMRSIGSRPQDRRERQDPGSQQVQDRGAVVDAQQQRHRHRHRRYQRHGHRRLHQRHQRDRVIRLRPLRRRREHRVVGDEPALLSRAQRRPRHRVGWRHGIERARGPNGRGQCHPGGPGWRRYPRQRQRAHRGQHRSPEREDRDLGGRIAGPRRQPPHRQDRRHDPGRGQLGDRPPSRGPAPFLEGRRRDRTASRSTGAGSSWTVCR